MYNKLMDNLDSHPLIAMTIFSDKNNKSIPSFKYDH